MKEMPNISRMEGKCNRFQKVFELDMFPHEPKSLPGRKVDNQTKLKISSPNKTIKLNT